MRRFYTIGYEGADIDSFIDGLLSAGITLLVDVRQLPLSRKKGFSKRGLAAELQNRGLKYMHRPALGDPKPGREAAKAGNLSLFKSHLLDTSKFSRSADGYERPGDRHPERGGVPHVFRARPRHLSSYDFS